ncbi:MAG: ExeM/NucH family extracellular endonuclease, partial [Anaerolineae bacterium]|nr:ExeM/NucH family extracellular endonuclease [Anaerolineae bacterium]
VASFNVLNYFNGDGAGGGFPTSRGATNPAEFTRQREKIIAAIVALDADVVGLMEIENDGDGPESAVADLVDGLNAAAGAGTYAYVSDPAGFPLPEAGGDAIKVAVIYQPSAVTPVGDALTDLDPVFSRAPVALTFEQVGTGGRFTVIVNHFKSKGCTDAADLDRDQGDGQECYNAARTLQAQQMVNFVAAIQASSGDEDVLVTGDLNSYAMEDPITTLTAGGLVNLIGALVPDTYSYVYFGQSGTLDHALATESLREQVSGVAVWHINADEPRVLDYNEEYKTAGQVTSFYSPDPYRSSDHDPVIVGLNLSSDSSSGGPAEGDTGQPSGAETEKSDDGNSTLLAGLAALAAGLVLGIVLVIQRLVAKR